MHCRLSLAAMLDHPEYLTAEAASLQPLSQGELSRQGRSPDQSLAPILARAAQAAWAAVQVRISPLLTCCFGQSHGQPASD